MNRFFNCLVPVLSLMCATAYAKCERVNFADLTGDNFGASLHFGTVNLTNDYIQPEGTLLASSVFSLVPATHLSDPETVMYRCDIEDKDKIYEVFATNGDSNVGGYTHFGNGYYQTYFRNTALKLTHLNSGLTFTRIWQAVPLKNYDVNGNKIEIKAKHFSRIKAELIKTSKYDSTPGPTLWGCAGPAAETYTGSYICNQPNGYVAFSGPGLELPEIGTDSAYNYPSWGLTRYMAFGMNTSPATVLTRENSCVIQHYTTQVNFPVVSQSALEHGEKVVQPFEVTTYCQNGFSGNTTLAIQASLPAFNAAVKEGLVNTSGGVSYLLSDNYGKDGYAKGVGIRLSDSKGLQRYFVGWSGCDSNCTDNPDTGIYPLTQNASIAEQDNNHTVYTTTFNASLEKIPGMDVTPGKVLATGYVIVRIQ
ncbi:fimbrial protein [Cronobacter dublinensis]|uniref:fimbrial protein n=2 Tax=Cronobacter dublinensis TaxID=413497 RepID=UPI00300DDA06